MTEAGPDAVRREPQLSIPWILEIREQIKTLPGQRVMNAMRDLDRPVRFLLAPNGAELVQLLAAFEEHPNAVMLWAQGNEEQMDAFLGEVQRKTHNLVASVVTVIDHTRRILHKEWPDAIQPIRAEFVAARQVFLTDGRLVLVRDMRNFCLHRSLPNIVGQINFIEQASVTNRALLSKASLLEWNGWRAPAKAYLEAADDTIQLRPLVVHYVDQALALHNAVINSIRAHEADVLAPWQALAEEHDAYVNEIRRRTDPSYVEPEPASSETSPASSHSSHKWEAQWLARACLTDPSTSRSGTVSAQAKVGIASIRAGGAVTVPDITDSDQPESFSKDDLADYLGVTPEQLDEAVEEYRLAPLPDPISKERARELRSSLSHACIAFGLAEASGGHTPERRPSWVQAPGDTPRQFSEI